MEKKDSKHTLYLMGGSARSGKTTISEKIIKRKHLVNTSTDIIRATIRNVFIGEPRVTIEKIEFKGKARFRRPGDLKVHEIKFAKDLDSDDELTWAGVLGFINTYDRKNHTDVLIEGIAITPERVSKLRLKNLSIRAVFLGYNNESHATSILKYAKKQKDWVNVLIQEHNGDDIQVREWVRKEVLESNKLKTLTKKLGYGYFDITERPFKEHVQAVVDYLLKS